MGFTDLPGIDGGKINRNMEKRKNNQKLVLTPALSYWSRFEIIEAVKKLCRRVRAGTLSENDITETVFSKELFTADMPDPDLLIRTSGEYRLSNFLLWQISYSELYVSEKYWPDFNKADFVQAVGEYQKRERRFGGTAPTAQCRSNERPTGAWPNGTAALSGRPPLS